MSFSTSSTKPNIPKGALFQDRKTPKRVRDIWFSGNKMALPPLICLCAEVRDTGIGIAAEDQKRLFMAFEQADTSLNRKYGGTGLGLAINKRLARMMAGGIEVRSQPGSGSTFMLTARLNKCTNSIEAAKTTG